MKRIFIVLFIGILIQIGNAQENKHQQNTEISNKGKFHIGVQNLSLQDHMGVKVFTLSPRIGYMITDKDMVFADMELMLYSRLHDGNNNEFSLNFRRFLNKKAFRPFLQAGIGYGSFDYNVSTAFLGYNVNVKDDYMIYKIGAGFSFTYKRWSIETGLQADYNKLGNSVFRFKPVFGVSFSL